MFDKIGAAIIGLFVGVVASGVLAIVAQQLPFGTAALGYSAYATEDAEYGAPRRLAERLYKVPRGEDTTIMMPSVVKASNIGDEEARQSLWVPVDQWVVGIVESVMGRGGSLTGPTRFDTVYPEGSVGYVDALFGRRVGMQLGVQRIAINNEERQDVQLHPNGAFFSMNVGPEQQFKEPLRIVAGDDWAQVRESVPLRYTPTPGTTPVVLRLKFGDDAGENYMRFGTGNARLVIGDQQLFPIGTLESGRVIVQQAPDDRLLAPTGADLVYEFDSALLQGEAPALPDDAFLEFKHYARLPLAGERIYRFVTVAGDSQVLRKQTTRQRIRSSSGR